MCLLRTAMLIFYTPMTLFAQSVFESAGGQTQLLNVDSVTMASILLLCLFSSNNYTLLENQSIAFSYCFLLLYGRPISTITFYEYLPGGCSGLEGKGASLHGLARTKQLIA